MAKSLLDSKNVSYAEIDVTHDPSRRAEMVARAGGRRTVPEIFIDGHLIGGFDELDALERTGKLDRILVDAG
jgi:glutaredoxin 3